ncbi:MAG TPA: hypothetical protein PLD23_09200 [Armatimonadota bacterium]|nr:hypothetical protein [Armatimonadota bacterium]HQK93669.1 hypothetical protein [Armatimonadota bacterium]
MRTLSRAIGSHRAIAALVVIGLCSAAAYAAITIGKVLPPSDAVAGWKIVPKTYKECPNPSGLAELYDGGWEKYRDAGIIAAATQTYKGSAKQIVIYAHEFSSAERAKAYYASAQKNAKGKITSVQVAGGQAFYSVTGPATVGNVVRGKVQCQVAAMGSTADMQQAVAAFLKVLANRVGQVYK